MHPSYAFYIHSTLSMLKKVDISDMRSVEIFNQIRTIYLRLYFD